MQYHINFYKFIEIICNMKTKIHESCRQYVHQRMQTALQSIAAVQAAGEEDTKSSAGDKFETGREMMKQEIERHQQLLAEAQRMASHLEMLNLQPSPITRPGSLIQTDKALFYLAIGIGKMIIEEKEVLILSPASPVGQLLSGKRKDDVFSFNKTTYKVLEIQ